jgi:hypothetical protein
MSNHPNRSRTRKVSAVLDIETRHTSSFSDGYDLLLRDMQVHFNSVTASNPTLFETDADTDRMWERYLRLAPDRQYYNCSCCRHFIKRFGGLVIVTPEGRVEPAVWPKETVETFNPVVWQLRPLVMPAQVVRPFYTRETVIGTPRAGGWTHFSIEGLPVLRHAVLTPGQRAAAKLEDFKNVRRALVEFSEEVLTEALRVLEADAINRSERFTGPVQWLLDLKRSRSETRDQRIRDNLLWAAVATAPDGYCHPRSSVVATLLEDIEARKPFEVVRRNWNAKTHPLRYQRPQAAPKLGNIAAAEKLVEKLGIQRSLERRYARVDEIEAIWRPREATARAEAPTGGVFSHLQGRTAGRSEPSPSLSVPPVVMTWEKFARTVLPTAEAMEALVPRIGNFSAMLTAAHEDAPPIIAWDREDRRNPFSSYIYHRGSTALSWRLQPGTWVKVTAVVLRPNMWGDNPLPHHGERGTLILEGAADTKSDEGNALFP